MSTAGKPREKPPLASTPHGPRDDALSDVRRFHLGAAGEQESSIAGLLPAHLASFRVPEMVRDGYPLLLLPAQHDAECRIGVPLGDLLQESVVPERARLLHDNLPRLERWLRRAVAERAGLLDARALMSEAGEALQQELGLRKEAALTLQRDLDSVLGTIPEHGQVLGYGARTPLHLLLAAASRRMLDRRQEFCEQVEQTCQRLRSALQVEAAKDPEAAGADALRHSVGKAADSFMDPAALAEILGKHRGSKLMPPGKRERLEQALATLQAWLCNESEPLLTVVHDTTTDVCLLDPQPGVRTVHSEDPATRAAAVFDADAARLTEVFCAQRVARLELEGQYDPERHDPWLEEFDWEAFSKAELLLVPPVVALESAACGAGEGMVSLSRLLQSARPVQVLVTVPPAQNPAAGRDTSSYRLELAYFGISHRQALVHQSSSARPEHLIKGLLAGLDATSASLHVITSCRDADGKPPLLGPWLHASAALEGRAHPMFLYDPAAGATWARRLDFAENPQPELDWPVQTLDIDGDKVPVAFTFADFALLEPGWHRHFKVIAGSVTGDDLVPIADYLALPDEDAVHRIPFLYAVDADGQRVRLAVTRYLVQACRDRLGFWRTLQELAGIRNEYVKEATEKVRQEFQEAAEQQRQELQSAHREELEQARAAAAEDALQNLARALLSTDWSAPVERSPTTPVAAPPVAPEVVAPPEPEVAEAPAEAPAAEPEVAEEPWIDSPMCTSCNDCLAINPLLFVYDDNKQAMIGDPHAGSFAQLVKAAEKCPARCIHPGQPLDQSEPNLDELIQRAAPFNGGEAS